MDYFKDQLGELYEPCGSGLTYHCRADYQIQETDELLVIKSPRSVVRQLIMTAIIVLVFWIFIVHFFNIESQYKVMFYVGAVPMFLVVVLFIYVFVGFEHKKGDWLVWDKTTGKIDFPRLSESDVIDNFVCFQLIRDERDNEDACEEVNCIFKSGHSFRRYPLFLTDDYGIGSHVYNMAHPFGVGVQKVYFRGKEPVVGGYQFETGVSGEDSV